MAMPNQLKDYMCKIDGFIYSVLNSDFDIDKTKIEIGTLYCPNDKYKDIIRETLEECLRKRYGGTSYLMTNFLVQMGLWAVEVILTQEQDDDKVQILAYSSSDDEQYDFDTYYYGSEKSICLKNALENKPNSISLNMDYANEFFQFFVNAYRKVQKIKQEEPLYIYIFNPCHKIENLYEKSISMATTKLVKIDQLKTLTNLSLSNFVENYKAEVQKQATKSAIAAIMSRNMSHNLGSHVISGTKNYLVNSNYILDKEGIAGKGIYHLYQYLQERMDYVSMIINSSHNGYMFNAPLNLKADILDAFAVDGRDKRHNKGKDDKQTKSFLLDYIVRSEHIARDNPKDEEIKLELMLLLKNKDGGISSFSSEANGDNDTNTFNKINFSVPFGLNSRHAFLTILENYLRNSAKHNKSAVPHGTLVISVMVEAIGDDYEITVFDNKKDDSGYLDSGIKKLKLQDLIEKIQILKPDSSLDTDNKGIKEMLICASWLQAKNDWSNLNEGIFTYKIQSLEEIYNGITKITNEGENSQRKEERKERLKYYSNKEEALAIQFKLPQHKWVCYKKVEEIKAIYELPSADFYAIETIKENEEKIKQILPHVIFVETKDNVINFKNETDRLFSVNFTDSDITDAINNEKTLRLCYEHLYYKEKNDNRVIFINYANPNNITSEIEKIARDGNGKDINKIDINNIKNKKVYIFNNHNDTPSIFATHYDWIKTNFTQRQFIEGISGASYNYNLLINAPINPLNYYKIVEACDTKIAIIDERIYVKYRNLRFADKIPTDIFDKYNNELANAQKHEDLSDKCRKYLFEEICKQRRGQDQEIDELIKNKYQIPVTKIYNKAFLEEKGIFIYNYNDSRNKLMDIDGTEISSKIEKKFDYVSVHYSILSDKYLKDDKKIKIPEKYTEFIDTFFSQKDNMRRVIHSGRGGIADIAEEETFVTLSTIEACLEDCKYKLSQLFLNLKYKPWQPINKKS